MTRRRIYDHFKARFLYMCRRVPGSVRINQKSVKSKPRISLELTVQGLEPFRVRIGPVALDRKAFGISDIVRPFARIDAGDNKKLNLLGREVLDPCFVIRRLTVPSRPRIGPGSLSAQPSLLVVIVHEPGPVLIDIHVPDVIAQIVAEQVVGQVGPRVRDPAAVWSRAGLQMEPTCVKVGERRVERKPTIAPTQPAVEPDGEAQKTSRCDGGAEFEPGTFSPKPEGLPGPGCEQDQDHDGEQRR